MPAGCSCLSLKLELSRSLEHISAGFAFLTEIGMNALYLGGYIQVGLKFVETLLEIIVLVCCWSLGSLPGLRPTSGLVTYTGDCPFKTFTGHGYK